MITNTDKKKPNASSAKESAQRTVKKSKASTGGIKKEYLKTKNICKVTFRLPRAAVVDGNLVYIVGDFNNWDTNANPMKKLKNGDHTIKLDLEPGREYQYRYFIDNGTWENDWQADKYIPTPYGDSDNSVVVV